MILFFNIIPGFQTHEFLNVSVVRRFLVFVTVRPPWEKALSEGTLVGNVAK